LQAARLRKGRQGLLFPAHLPERAAARVVGDGPVWTEDDRPINIGKQADSRNAAKAQPVQRGIQVRFRRLRRNLVIKAVRIVLHAEGERPLPGKLRVHQVAELPLPAKPKILVRVPAGTERMAEGSAAERLTAKDQRRLRAGQPLHPDQPAARWVAAQVLGYRAGSFDKAAPGHAHHLPAGGGRIEGTLQSRNTVGQVKFTLRKGQRLDGTGNARAPGLGARAGNRIRPRKRLAAAADFQHALAWQNAKQPGHQLLFAGGIVAPDKVGQRHETAARSPAHRQRAGPDGLIVLLHEEGMGGWNSVGSVGSDHGSMPSYPDLAQASRESVE